MLVHASVVAFGAQKPVMQAISMCGDTASLTTSTSLGFRSGATIHGTGKSWGWLNMKIVAGLWELGEVFLNLAG